MKCAKLFSALATLALLLTFVAAPAGDDIPIKDLPKAVVEAIKARFPDAVFLEAEKEGKRDGKTKYEVEIRSQGKKYEVDILEDGTILKVERDD